MRVVATEIGHVTKAVAAEQKNPARGTRRVQLVRGEGRGVSN
jgi:hypothetical protein